MPWLCWRLCVCSPFLMLMLLLLAPHAAGGWLDAFLLLLLLLELFFSFVSATRYKTGYDHILLGDLICMFFLLVLYSPSPPVSVPDPTQALTFDPALGVAFAVVVAV